MLCQRVRHRPYCSQVFSLAKLTEDTSSGLVLAKLQPAWLPPASLAASKTCLGPGRTDRILGDRAAILHSILTKWIK
jgi:hypothetical protein